jgi:glycosyltransferase involved in cell wall biosynthesis
MKVALESSSLFFKNYTGIPFYIYNLFNAMLAVEDVSPMLAFRLKKKFSSHNDFHKQLLKKDHVWHFANQPLSTIKFDVVHSLHTPFLNPKRTLNVATVHDLAVHLPQFKDFDFASDYFKKKRLALFKTFAEKADVIITVSEATKSDFLGFFNFPEERIHAIPLAPSFNFFNSKAEFSKILKELGLTSKQYFISMGGVSLRKNTFNLIKAYHRSKSKADFKLVITGKIEAAHEQDVRDYIISNKLENDILLTKYLPNCDLKELYINAKAFLFPTFYEGFGIPILEAMLAELPVLTSTTGAAPETAGGFAILVDPFDPESIAEGIDKLKYTTQEHLDKAKAYAVKHTWDKTAKLTTSIYEKYM